MTTAFAPVRRGTILIPSGPVKHLHFVCSDVHFYAELYSPDRITEEVIEGNFDVHQPCTEELMQKILDGFQVTREVKRYVQKFCEAHCSPPA